ncbi:MAG: hypothetical protein WAN35_16765 [Terracidiphilus sp.]
MPKLATVDSRYLSYNVEMVEVTGGRFWKPYKDAAKADTPPQPNQEIGANPGLYQYRSPIDLSNPRLRKLATALGPAYIRVSGTWQNSTYFQNNDDPALQQPPTGFKSVLTRAQWKGVVGFSRAVDAKIVTSVAISPGARGADGVWAPAQAQEIYEYTKSLGASIAATEFMNEPTIPLQGGAPQGYDAETFAKDIKAFSAFLRKESPNTVFLGPGGVGEGISLLPAGMKMKMLGTEELMKATGPAYDAFSYHFYGTVSQRCMGNMKIDQALSAEWLGRTDVVEAFYASLRDRYLAGKPIWLTETAQAACGGDRFAGQFADSFRFLNQLGSLAQKGVQVVMHNTLASSDYGLLNEATLEPRPNYWAALLWKRTMGTIVLNPGAPPDMPKGQSLRIYAQCMKDTKGGVTLMALNTDTKNAQRLSIPAAGDRYTLTALDLASDQVLLNGIELRAALDGSLPAISGQRVQAGDLELAPESITFLTLPSARNKNCQQ